MIVSHRLSIAFVKTRKTAGTSVELAMSSLCGPRDIITPVTSIDEQIRRSLGGRGPQRHLAPWSSLSPRQAAQVLMRREKRPLRFYNHIPATAVIGHLGYDVWDRYLTVTIERNPWDRAASLYYWRKMSHGVRHDFPSWLLHAIDERFLSNWPIYADGDSILVDQVIRYETLRDDLSDLWRKLGVTPPRLPLAKAGIRPPMTEDWRPLYTDDTAEYIPEVCAAEIAVFGYRFDDAAAGKRRACS